jgi:protein TonB
MVRNATLPQARQHLDPVRIVAISVSIVVNIALLAVLMRPLEYTTPVEQPDHAIQGRIIPAKVIKDPVIVRHLTTIKPHPQTLPHPVQVVQPKPVVISTQTAPIDVPATQTTPVDTTPPPTQTLSTEPVETSLIRLAAPAPMYPRDALRDGITGTVELELLVGVDGSVLKVRVLHSSGNHQLDAAAQDQVLRTWRFQPALVNGVPVQALGHVPIVFSLDGR